MSHIEAKIEINPLSQELISEFLISELGFGGIVVEEKIYENADEAKNLPNANEACFDEMSSSHIIKAYCENLAFSEDEIQSKLYEQRANLIECGINSDNLGTWKASFDEIDDESWATNWKEHWDVQKVGEHTVICPSWLEYKPAFDEVKLDLDPGAAFGTGTHATTRLCIKELEKMIVPNCKLVDVGCGSGILSIAAAKYGVSQVVGVDIDETSVEVAINNAKKNNVNCSFSVGSAAQVKGKYEIVVANILAHIIIEILPDLISIMNDDGILLLSGIIEDKKDEMQEALKAHKIEVLQISQEGEWLCIVAKKSPF